MHQKIFLGRQKFDRLFLCIYNKKLWAAFAAHSRVSTVCTPLFALRQFSSVMPSMRRVKEGADRNSDS